MSIFLRPSLSPKWPKTTPPTGRAAKPTQKVAKAANWAASGESFGEKNSGPKTKAAAVPYRKKSYHSMDVPIQLAIATRTIGELLLDTWVSLMITSYHDSHGGCRVLQLHQMYVARKNAPFSFSGRLELLCSQPQTAAVTIPKTMVGNR